MNLRHLVPALGILASTSGALFAENVGGLTVGGFVDTIGTVSDTEKDGTGTQKYFTSAVELRVGYKVGDKVTTQIDLEWNNASANDTDLEQAYVNYAISDTISITSGKFTSYSGWTAVDADGLYRINLSPITQLYATDMIGVAVNFAPSDDLGVSLFVINGLRESYNDDTNEYVAVAGDVVYRVQDVGSFNLEAGYDQIDSSGSLTDSEINVGANTTLKLASYAPLTLGAEVLFVSRSNEITNVDTDRLGFLVMGNHTIPSTPFPMSATAMFTLVNEEVDVVGPADTDTDTMEIALALLTNPTSDSHFGLNAEVAYQSETGDTGAGPSGRDDVDSILFAVELITVIP